MINEKVEDLNVKLSSNTINPLKSMWVSARNCYFKGGFDELNNKYNEDEAVKLLKSIYSRGHKSIFENASFQYLVEGASRSLLAQLTRHRIGFSFAVQSQHFQKHSDFHYKDLEKYTSSKHREEYYELMEQINKFYKSSMEQGIPRYIAREVLPNSTSVHLTISANLRALDHFWELRQGKENTPEIRKLSKQMYEQTQIVIPRLNEIIKYG